MAAKTPGPQKKKTSIVLDEKLRERLQIAAVKERTDLSSLLARLGREYLSGKRSRS